MSSPQAIRGNAGAGMYLEQKVVRDIGNGESLNRNISGCRIGGVRALEY